MIQIYLITECCSRGYFALVKIHEELKNLDVDSGIMSIDWFAESELVKKYDIKKEDCPRIIIDEQNLTIAEALNEDYLLVLKEKYGSKEIDTTGLS